MDKLIEIKSSLENLWIELKDGNSDSRGLVKDFEHIETLAIETLLSVDKKSSVGMGLSNIIAVARDVVGGSLNVEVDYPYICDQIEHILKSLN
ncbi:MAG: hypothetical protein HRU03_02860 [Nanoarchaeales archaeon]|nr:hypothetical protein [Nanoarchaeales archaeon]